MSEFIKAARVLGFWRTVWARFCYRHVMRFAHRYNWHYAPVFGPYEDGSTQRWCQWCGLRQTTPKLTSPLSET